MQKIIIFCLSFLFFFNNILAQIPQNLAVQINATVVDVPPRITLNWSAQSTIIQFQIFRKLKTENTWGSAIATLPGSSVQFIDNNVQQNVSYEYKVFGNRANGVSAVGYINAGIKLLNPSYNGKLFLIIDGRFQNSLAPEIARLINDLENEGWSVVVSYFMPTESVVVIKNYIFQQYYADVQNSKAIFLLGHLPVPYSGQIFPDGHLDHEGAWPADVFYGDIDGTWTDFFVNSQTASLQRNRNIPGDGKYDQSLLPSDIELQVGRVDMFGLSAFSSPEVLLLKNYLDKNHDYRSKNFTVNKRAVIDDNFGYFNGESFASGAWRSFSPIVGNANVFQSDYFNSMTNQSCLWSFGCGAGTYTSAFGIGTTSAFANADLQGIFSSLFGSYFGDWNSTNSLLKAPLAQGKILSCVWSGRPIWTFHHMALGETIGYSALISQNNTSLYVSNYGARFIHTALLGDPTLKNDIVSPVSNVVATKSGNNCNISWQISTDNVIGYNVFQKTPGSTVYSKLNSTVITTNNFTDSCLVVPGVYSYQVRAVKLEVTPSGSYYNQSIGVADTVLNTNNFVIEANFNHINNSNQISFVSNSTNSDSFLWDFGNGNVSNLENPIINFPDGVYYITLIASNNCNSDTIQKIIGVGDFIPSQPSNFILYSDSICQGSTNIAYSVQNVTGTTYTWNYSGSGVIISGIGNQVSLNFSNSATSGILRVFPSNIYGTGTPQELEIVVKENPIVSISGTTTICNGTSTNLFANGASNYLWSNGSTENYIVVSPSNTTSFGLIGVNLNGCSNSVNQLVTVNVVPNTPTLSILSGSNPFCFGSTISLRSNYTSGNIWSNGAFTRDVTLSSSQTIYLKVSINGCNSDSIAYNVTRKPQIISEINGITSTCEGATSLSATQIENYPTSVLYKWTYPNNSINYGIIQNVNLSGVYQLQVIPSDLCPSQSSSVTVSISSASNPQIDFSGDTVLCEGENLTLTAPSGATYLWSNGSNQQSISVNQSGNYFVTILSGNCSGNSDTIAVNVIPIQVPSLNITVPSLEICNIDVVLLTANSNFPDLNPVYQWKKNGLNVGSNSIEFVDSLLINSDVINCEAVFSQGCLSTYSAISNNISFTVENCGSVWTGIEDNNWSNNLNWSTLEVPSSITSVRVPPGVPNLPELSETSYCNNLNVLGGMSLSLNDRKLVISGQINGAGNFIGSNLSEIEIIGTSNSGVLNFSQSNDYTKSLGKLILECDNISLNSKLDLYDELEIRRGAFRTNNNLILKSTSEKTARIAAVQNIEQSEILGRVKVEKYIVGGLTGWVGLGNPVKRDSIINWMDDFATSGFPGSTGYAGGFVSVFWYNESVYGNSKQGYTPPVDAYEQIRIGRGYMVFLGDGLNTTNDILYDATGLVHIGDHDFNITYTTSIPVQLDDDDGWNLISNPYCSNIDWDSPYWIKNGIFSPIYIYDPDNKQYTTYITEDQIGINGGTNVISSNQSFWIKAKNNGSQLIASENVKTSQSINFFRTSNASNFIKIKLLNNQLVDETVLVLKDNATNEFDENMDALKLYSPIMGIHNISTKLGNSRLAINSINTFAPPSEIPLEIKVSAPGFYSLSFELGGNSVWLKDNQTMELVSLNTDTTFSIFIIDTLLYLNKYSIVLQNITTSINSSSKSEIISLYPNPSSNGLCFTLSDNSKVNKFEIVDMCGKLLVENNHLNSVENKYEFLTNLKSGIYFVKFFHNNTFIESKKWVIKNY